MKREQAIALGQELKRRGLNQGTIAVQLGMHESALSKILTGVRRAPDGFEVEIRAAMETVAREQATVLLGTSNE